MRLIDADEFIKKFKYASADTEEQKIMCMTVRRMINEQPTAYDVDTVVNQLELHSFSLGITELPAFYVRLNDAIKIVKGGGVDE